VKTLEFVRQRGSEMRLSNKEISVIKKAVTGIDPLARIFLFGSRTDDSKKGGDIDLLIMSDFLGRAEKRKIKFRLWDTLGEQKIDMLIAGDLTDPFVRMAKKGGIEL